MKVIWKLSISSLSCPSLGFLAASESPSMGKAIYFSELSSLWDERWGWTLFLFWDSILLFSPGWASELSAEITGTSHQVWLHRHWAVPASFLFFSLSLVPTHLKCHLRKSLLKPEIEYKDRIVCVSTPCLFVFTCLTIFTLISER